jgi:DNA polymerase-3 subunit alpha
VVILSYVPLDVHSVFSTGDGLCRIDDLAERAARYGLPAVALTDLACATAHRRFRREAESRGLRPVLGAGVRVLSLLSPTPTNREAFHLLLLARDDVGYRNLLRIITLSHNRDDPLLTAAELESHARGLVAVSGALSGEVARRILSGRPDRARRVAARLREIFGPEGTYLGISRCGTPEEDLAGSFSRIIAERLEIPLVAAHPLRYVDAEDREAYRRLRAVSRLEEPPVLVPDRSYPPRHLIPPQEMEELYRDLPEALENTRRLAEGCTASLPEPDPWDLERGLGGRLPAWSALVTELEVRLRRRYGDGPRYREARRRLGSELASVTGGGGQPLWLIAWDLVRHLHARGFRCGPGRAPVTGSLIAHLMDLSDVDPVDWNLPEAPAASRGLGGVSWMHLDLPPGGREEGHRYLVETWGEDRVGHVSGYESYTPRRLIRELGRALHFGEEVLEELATAYARWDSLPLRAALKVSGPLQRLFSESEEVRDLLKAAMRLEGLPRRLSAHPGEVIVSSSPLGETFAVQRAADGHALVQAEREELEGPGHPCIGLHNLHFVEIVQKVPAPVNLEDRVPDSFQEPLDAGVVALLGQGDTVGVYRLESPPMARLCARLGPRTFGDLVLLLSLAQTGRRWDSLLARFGSAGEEGVEVNPLLRDRLRGSRGLLLYEEQVESIAGDLAGLTPSEVGGLVAAIREREAGALASAKRLFMQGAANRGVEPEAAEAVFQVLLHEAADVVSLAQSVAWARLTYRCAFLKTHARDRYLLEALRSNRDQPRRVQAYLTSLRDAGLAVRGVDVNQSSETFRLEEGALRLGLDMVRALDGEDRRSILRERGTRGAFRGVGDFVDRIRGLGLGRAGLSHLVLAGGLDALEDNRAAVLGAVEMLIREEKEEGEPPGRGPQLTLDLGREARRVAGFKLPRRKPFSRAERERLEQQALRVDVRREVGGARRRQPVPYVAVSGLAEIPEGSLVRVAGMIERLRKVKARSGECVAFFFLREEEAGVAVRVGSREYERWAGTLEEGRRVDVVAWVRRKADRTELVYRSPYLHVRGRPGLVPPEERATEARARVAGRAGAGTASAAVWGESEAGSGGEGQDAPLLGETTERLALRIPDRFTDYERLVELLRSRPGLLGVVIRSGGVRRKAWSDVESLHVRPSEDLLELVRTLLGEEGSAEVIDTKRLH